MEFIQEQLTRYGANPQQVDHLSAVIMVVLIAAICVIANFIAKKIVLQIIVRIITSNKVTWDNVLLEKKVFHHISHIVPAIIIYFAGSMFPSYQNLIEKAALTYIIVVTLVVINALLNAFDIIYRTFPVSKARPIKGYIQVVKITLFIVGGITVISNLIGQNPFIILSGLGALSAVLMLIFKDSILGLVAGVQLSSNDMVRVGDWIEMPKYDADGDVIDITLNTVKVMNFDKTITMIPSYALISDSFKNWRGMQTSGGRRIKRSIFIDTGSIHFCSEETIKAYNKIHYLSDYIATALNEIEHYNEERNIDKSSKVNGRQLTNIGVFRVYIQQYLKHHPKIHQDMTLIVRQLAPGDSGLPLEIYAFTNDINWVVYESVQSDIFDHIFAVAPSFGLRAFQNPTGYDIASGIERNAIESLDERNQKRQTADEGE
ncbi:mechanosensitive ion channel family protein [Paenibacillus nasutitermitis]|uniref:Mechanosensing system component YbdG n=1 Tax=Paenibacillus nasutitermitis TaxID=1652958 RepID=A0A916ZMA5_9BACL|nr:mechanosensitive ion channel domain-containing protein [Paenibacillus nasutitermitis]GGE02872.1 membrane protein [Paenibacillus nasutitermitis]